MRKRQCSFCEASPVVETTTESREASLRCPSCGKVSRDSKTPNISIIHSSGLPPEKAIGFIHYDTGLIVSSAEMMRALSLFKTGLREVVVKSNMDNQYRVTLSFKEKVFKITVDSRRALGPPIWN